MSENHDFTKIGTGQHRTEGTENNRRNGSPNLFETQKGV